MKLILIRHGKTEANEKRLYCGSTDIGLSEKGAAELAELRKAAAYPDISGMRIITSGMKRCEETLRLIYGDIPHETEKDLRETDFGHFEMRSYEELKNDPLYLEWISSDNERNIPPNGESGEQTARRVIRALKRILADGRDTLLITHGGVIAVITAYLFPDESKSRYDRQPPCGGGYIINTDTQEYEKLF